MQWFRNLRTVAKLMLGFGLMAALMCVLGYMSVRNLSTLNTATRNMYEHHALGLAHIKEADTQLVNVAKALRDALLTQPAEREHYLGQIKLARERFSAEFNEFQKLIQLAATRSKAEQTLRLYEQMNAMQDRVVELMKANQRERAIAQLVPLRVVYAQMKAGMDEMTASKLERLKSAADDVEKTSQSEQTTTIAVVSVTILLAIALGFLIARGITRPLGVMVQVAGKLAAGDVDQKIVYRSQDETGQLAQAFSVLIETVKGLTAEIGSIVQSAKDGDLARRGDTSRFTGAFRDLVGGMNATLEAFSAPVKEASSALEQVSNRDMTARMDGDYKGDFAVIKSSLNKAVENISAALVEVKGSADHVADTSRALTAASEEISSGAQEQASSLEETAASLEEMTSTVKQNAENARQASQLAAGSRDSAEKGGHIVRAAVTAMGEINEASKRIADIITTIDEIAFQTNLLALNAAVEAARAGEQGRGFAVVASEVRNLAQRSASAAKEIKVLIQDSVRKVENGSALVNQSGQTLDEIVQSVKRVTDIVAEIAAASQEQATGIDQVNKATIQMDQVTQANSAQTEEMSSTAQGLSSSAEQLQNMVGQFRLPGVQTLAKAPIYAPHVRPVHKSGVRPQVNSLLGLARKTGTSEQVFEEF